MKTMKRFFAGIGATVLAATLGSCFWDSSQPATPTTPAPIIPPAINVNVGSKPLNISVYLDLSDRITKNAGGLSQQEKDIAIVERLSDILYATVCKKKARDVKDRMKVFFYPVPSTTEVRQASKDLTVDLGTAKDKLTTLQTMKDNFQDALTTIYASTLNDGNFIGSDIWGFFNEQVDVQCIKAGYRNVLVIVTDGYIYHRDNIVQNGSAYSYILPQTLRRNGSLIVGKQGLGDLEVLILEVNANPNTDYPKMKQVLEKWLQGMGVQKYQIVKTDIPSQTESFIDRFLEQE